MTAFVLSIGNFMAKTKLQLTSKMARTLVTEVEVAETAKVCSY